jgi:SAM-dependent methyltransferase
VGEGKDPGAYQESLASGRAIFKEKYHGLDAWDDILNFELGLLSFLNRIHVDQSCLNALAVDVRCGTPVLEMRNHFRKRGIPEPEVRAFTTKAKYYLDLRTVAHDAQCDRIDFIQNYYPNDTFKIILLGEPVNLYPEPVRLLQRLYDLLVPGGLLLFKLRNANDVTNLFFSLGLGGASDREFPASIYAEDLNACLKLFGHLDIQIIGEANNFNEADRASIGNLLGMIKGGQFQADMERLMIRNYLYCVQKLK